jgi:hypothetical protein
MFYPSQYVPHAYLPVDFCWYVVNNDLKTILGLNQIISAIATALFFEREREREIGFT